MHVYQVSPPCVLQLASMRSEEVARYRLFIRKTVPVTSVYADSVFMICADTASY